ncbi:MAG: serine/threonine protein kinase, partial [Nevskiaceae bacterium]|nr:serine/threonine protein kinase [Nevskiaceae bacterium]
AAAALPPGAHIGPFEVLAVLGEGGSSTVFRAARTIEGVRQQVALKLLRRTLQSPESRRQFQREQSALTQLHHPAIARLIEGGVTETGLAYIALELVDGAPITAHVREHRLDLRARLHLFLQVCRAVEAAHRALIVHRDLKPSNVLVTAQGDVKLLDFGVAKLLDADDQTQTRLPAFTPAYAAPEQFTGEPITTATDVYALGVLLGELITGQRLNDGPSRTPSSTIREDVEPGVLPASSAITRRQLRGDLDNVVLKAIESEPARRYATAAALADDIERLIDQRPVSAHPPSRWYRTRKFITRNRGAVAATLLFTLGIFAALGIALWQGSVARREALRANTVRAFVEGLFEPIRTGVASGQQPSLRDLLDQGVQRLDGDTALGPAEQVDLLLMFSRLYDYLNEPERMRELADRAGNLADTELGRDAPLAVDAVIARGIAALRREDYANAGPLLADAERRLEVVRQRDSGWTLAWIRVEDGLAAIANDRGDPAQALTHERAALVARIALSGEESADADGGYANLGFALAGTGQFAEAVVAYRRAYAGRAARDANSRTARLASTLGALGDVEMMAGQFEQAGADVREAHTIFDEVDAGVKASAAHISVAQFHCIFELAVGSPQAQPVCTHMLELARQDGPGATLGRVQRLAGMERLQSGDLEAASLALENSATLLDAALAPWQGRTNIARGELALVRGDAQDATALLARGIEQLGQAYPRYLHGYGLALLALACHEARDATDCAGGAEAAARKALDEDDYQWNPLLLPAHTALARVDLDAGRADEAARRLREAIAHAGVPVAETQPYLLAARLWLAVADAQGGSCDQARDEAQRTVALGQRPLADPHPLYAAAVRAARATEACGDLLSL